MAADGKLGVMLEPTNDLQDEVGDVEASVGPAGGGDLSAGQQEQQEGLIAGGVSKGLLAAGVIGGILSQLKSVSGLLEAIFGFFSRALLPAIEVIAELIRPLISGINDFIANPGQTVQRVGSNIQTGVQNFEQQPNRQILRALGFDENQIRGGQQNGENQGIVDVFEGLGLFGGPQSADQTGEATKNKFKNAVDDAQRDKTGSIR